MLIYNTQKASNNSYEMIRRFLLNKKLVNDITLENNFKNF